jgi:hypothetical protein
VGVTTPLGALFRRGWMSLARFFEWSSRASRLQLLEGNLLSLSRVRPLYRAPSLAG